MSWIKERSPAETLEILRAIASECLELSKGSPVTSEVYELVEQGNYVDLVSYQVDYNRRTYRHDFLYARQILGLYQKAEFLDLGIDKEAVAFKKFQDCEAVCSSVNATLMHGRGPLGPLVESVILTAQRKISRILGSAPTFEELDYSFGPGANTNVKSQWASPRAKLDADLVCSSRLQLDVGDLLAEVPLWAAQNSISDREDAWTVPVTVSPGKLTFVPKNAKTYRSIVVEPLLNGFVQKGIGLWLKQRLLRFGLDLRTQERNQALAYKASLDGSLATVDLSSASDTISRSVVRVLLPDDWYHLLDICRTDEVLYRGELMKLNKFSSMGNAFTFELESLIFWTVAQSVCELTGYPTNEVTTFGDDIIIPTGAYHSLCEVLSALGFSVNHEKSYFTGEFRESCGCDFLSGLSIRPYYQKSLVSDRTLYSMHNFFIRNGEPRLASLVESYTHPQYRLYGPDGFGDGHLIGSYQGRMTRQSRRSGWSGVFFDTYTLKPRSNFRQLPKGDFLLPTYSVYVRSGAEDPTDPHAVRGTKGYAKKSIYTLATGIFR